MKAGIETVLALILLLCLGWGCAAPSPSGATAVRESELASLPEGSVGLLVLEVASLRDLEPVARWLEETIAEAQGEAVLGQMGEWLGRETIEDLDRLALAVVPLEGSLGYGIMAEGEFDAETVRQALGGHETLTLIEVEGRPDFSITVLDGGELVLGPRRVLEEVRANAAGRKRGLVSNDKLLRLLDKVVPTSQVWGAIDYEPLADLARRATPELGAGQLPVASGPPPGSLLGVAFQGTIGEGVEIEIIGQAATEDDARQLSDAASGLIAIARLAAGQDEASDWPRVLDSIHIEHSGVEVEVHATLPEEAIAKLAERLPSTSREGSGKINP